MANPEHLAILKQGVKAWNEWREKNPDITPDLSQTSLFGEDLRGANLRNARLSKANLNRVDFSGADLSGAWLLEAEVIGAKFVRSILKGTRLDMATLAKTDLTHADLCNATLEFANLFGADLSDANLDGVDLTQATLVETHLERATITNCRVYGISAWNVGYEKATLSNLIITRKDEPTITVDDIEVAQFIYLMLNNQKIKKVIDALTSKTVLILGRFTDERKKVLDAIREQLRHCDYVPVIFDFDKPASRDVTETITLLARMARFIIADITDPSSIPLELQSVVPDLVVPVQPLLLSGQREFSMFVDLRKKYHWVLATHQYTDITDLLTSLGDKVIAPAEQKAKELEKR